MAATDERTQPIPAPADQPILVAIDFSADSRSALDWACILARCTGARLVLLHVIHDPASSPGFYVEQDQGPLQPMDAVGESRLAEFLTAAIAEHPELECLRQAEMRLAEGLPAGRIVEVAELLNARLIVLGNRGMSKLSRALQGSVARRVLFQTTRAVAVIKSAKGKKTKARADG